MAFSSFCFLEVLLGVSSGGRFLVWGAPFWAGGVLWGGCVCVVGVSVVLAFFWLRDAGLLCIGCSDGMGVDRLLLGGGTSFLVGIARSVLKGLTGLVGVGPSV